MADEQTNPKTEGTKKNVGNENPTKETGGDVGGTTGKDLPGGGKESHEQPNVVGKKGGQTTGDTNVEKES